VQYRPPPVRDLNGLNASVGWALFALLTGGLATPVLVGYACYRLRSMPLALGASAYLFSWSLFLVALGFGGHAGALLALGIFGWLACWLGGTAHAFLLGRQIHDADAAMPVRSADTGPREHLGNDAARATVERRRRLRREARALAAADPAMASELRIGRPDLRGDYDDGGLIDVNSAPVPVLRRLAGVDAEIAVQIVRWREVSGLFESSEEVLVHTDLDPRHLTRFAELALFVR
jgi:hypothetical protein